jgi:phosphoglycolate phosphatase
MDCRAVIFDLDGTLLNTLQDLADSVNKGLIELGLPTHPVEAYRYLVGDGREELALRAIPEDKRDPDTVERLIESINTEYSRRWADTTLPYPGIPELLDNLVARRINLAVLSNKPHDFTLLMVSRLLPRWQFEIVCGALPGVPKKPDCTAAVDIARKMSIKPENIIYLGDSGVDMLTAVSAGMYAVGALWGYRTANELKSAGALALISNPAELLQFLDT